MKNNTSCFLDRCAEMLWTDCGESLSEKDIILPSRRACMYFEVFLKEHIDRPVMLPRIMAFDDFVTKLSRLLLTDSTEQLFLLHEAYRSSGKPSKEDELDAFAPLGLSLLRDFEMLDKSRTKGSLNEKPEKLFRYLCDIKKLEGWADEFGTSDTPVSTKKSLEQYAYFWERVEKTYETFRARLLSEGKAYRGMTYAELAKDPEKLLDAAGIAEIIFVGLSEMNGTEDDLIKFLIKKKKARFLWDTDRFYTDKVAGHEAGRHFRKFRAKYGNAHTEYFTENGISETKREISIIEASNEIAQAKAAGEILKELVMKELKNKKLSDFKNEKSFAALIVPDAELLDPLLNSLPPESAEMPTQELINITMRMPMDNTPPAELLKSVFRMQENIYKREAENGETEHLIFYKDIQRILLHPYLSSRTLSTVAERTENPDAPLNPLERIAEENLIYFPYAELIADSREGKFYEMLFSPWTEKSKSAFAFFRNLMEFLSKEFAASGAASTLDREFLKQFYFVTERLQRLIEERKLGAVGISTLKRLMNDILRERKVPFTGQPLAPVQVMDMTSSRTLDFENVIIVGCNEGTIPRGKVINSLIPFDVRLEFGLPTHEHDDAHSAYMFYRLLHKAKNVFLIYNTDSSGGRKGEPSRFIRQIQEEFAETNTRIRQISLTPVLPEGHKAPRQILKAPQVLRGIRKRIEEDGLSPTNISAYLRNPLLFYLQNVLGIQEKDEVEEDLDHREFGKILHKMLEEILTPCIGKEVEPEYFENILKDPEKLRERLYILIEEEAGKIETKGGKNALDADILFKTTLRFLEFEKEEAPFTILALEHRLSHSIDFMQDNLKITMKLKGFVDRIDLKDGKLRIIDYKTGKSDGKELKVETTDMLFDPSKDTAKVIQGLLYHFLLFEEIRTGKTSKWAKLPEDTELLMESGFWFLKKIDEGFQSYTVTELNPANLKDKTEEFLHRLLLHMTNTEIPLTEEFEMHSEKLEAV